MSGSHLSGSHSRDRVAHLVDARSAEIVDVMGPLIQFLTTPEADDTTPCTMRDTIPPRVMVPLHSHADPETYVGISGKAERLAESAAGPRWVPIGPGGVFHLPGWAKHAFRNPSSEPAVMIVVSTSTIGRFFREIGTPAAPGSPPGPPSGEVVRHFLKTAQRYGYWNATPEENAHLGLVLPPYMVRSPEKLRRVPPLATRGPSA
jgi:quercetin dioxygenase-like cupin family protein